MLPIIKCIILALCSMFSILAFGLEKSETGTYVILANGQPSNMAFFFYSSEKEWTLEHRKHDGSWENVTCGEYCELHKSNEEDIVKFFPVNVLKNIKPSCVHNHAFAFCSFVPNIKPDVKEHILIILENGPKPVNVRKISNEKI